MPGKDCAPLHTPTLASAHIVFALSSRVHLRVYIHRSSMKLLVCEPTLNTREDHNEDNNLHAMPHIIDIMEKSVNINALILLYQPRLCRYMRLAHALHTQRF